MDRKRKNDIGLICLLLLIGGITFLGIQGYKVSQTKSPIAIITIDGTEYMRLSLASEQEVKVEGSDGYNMVVIADGKVWVKEASCPDHICIHQGKIDKKGETIVCLPNQMVIEVINGPDNEDGIDISTN